VNQSRSGVSSHKCAAQGFDREVALQAITCGPSNDATGEEVQNDGEGELALCRPDVADVCSPFPVGSVRCEVLRHQLGRDGPGMFILSKICPPDRFLYARIP
jgi:hypothetical protein